MSHSWSSNLEDEDAALALAIQESLLLSHHRPQPTPSSPPESQTQTPPQPTATTTDEALWSNIESYLTNPRGPRPLVTCSICQSELIVPGLQSANGDREPMRKLPCGHVLGERCTEQWINIRLTDGSLADNTPQCPFCRAPIMSEGEVVRRGGWVPRLTRHEGTAEGMAGLRDRGDYDDSAVRREMERIREMEEELTERAERLVSSSGSGRHSSRRHGGSERHRSERHGSDRHRRREDRPRTSDGPSSSSRSHHHRSGHRSGGHDRDRDRHRDSHASRPSTSTSAGTSSNRLGPRLISEPNEDDPNWDMINGEMRWVGEWPPRDAPQGQSSRSHYPAPNSPPLNHNEPTSPTYYPSHSDSNWQVINGEEHWVGEWPPRDTHVSRPGTSGGGNNNYSSSSRPRSPSPTANYPSHSDSNWAMVNGEERWVGEWPPRDAPQQSQSQPQPQHQPSSRRHTSHVSASRSRDAASSGPRIVDARHLDSDSDSENEPRPPPRRRVRRQQPAPDLNHYQDWSDSDQYRPRPPQPIARRQRSDRHGEYDVVDARHPSER